MKDRMAFWDELRQTVSNEWSTVELRKQQWPACYNMNAIVWYDNSFLSSCDFALKNEQKTRLCYYDILCLCYFICSGEIRRVISWRYQLCDSLWLHYSSKVKSVPLGWRAAEISMTTNALSIVFYCSILLHCVDLAFGAICQHKCNFVWCFFSSLHILYKLHLSAKLAIFKCTISFFPELLGCWQLS
jgi:hypothetical protein